MKNEPITIEEFANKLGVEPKKMEKILARGGVHQIIKKGSTMKIGQHGTMIRNNLFAGIRVELIKEEVDRYHLKVIGHANVHFQLGYTFDCQKDFVVWDDPPR